MGGSQQGTVLVVGGGLAGLRAAVDLADLGAQVLLIDKEPALGGTFTQLDAQYPTVDCGGCQILDSFAGPPWAEQRCLRSGVFHPQIATHTSTVVQGVEPLEGGGYRVTLRTTGTWIDTSRCIGCGSCAEVCPVTVVDQHEGGLRDRKATYRRHKQAHPTSYVIDEKVCTRCDACVPVCPEGAIDLSRGAVEQTVDVGAVVLATGFAGFDPMEQPEWGYGKHPDVLTGLELERHLSPGYGDTALRRRSDGSPVRRVAFVQCVGSRDKKRPYCSLICCMHALKEAIMLKERYGIDACHIYAIDMRCTGKGYEGTLTRAKAAGVEIIYARPGAVEPGERPTLLVETDGQGQRREAYDLVILSQGMVPPKGAAQLAELFGLAPDEHGFVASAPPLFVAGGLSGPCDIPLAVAQASEAAALAALALELPAKGRETEGEEEYKKTPSPRAATCHGEAPAGSVLSGLGFEAPQRREVVPRALIIGGGPAGLAAALTIAGAGFEVALVERSKELGGNLRLLRTKTASFDPQALRDQLVAEATKDPLIDVHTEARVVAVDGGVGDFLVTCEAKEQRSALRAGTTIVATGASALVPDGLFGYGQSTAIVTQLELESRLASQDDPFEGKQDPTVVMIQCVGSREPARPDCSRVCCQSAVKNALALTERYPKAQVLFLHRDLRATGMGEKLAVAARRSGVLFLRFDGDKPPRVEPQAHGAKVSLFDPLLSRDVVARADLVVLSTALVPALQKDRALAQALGIELSTSGFVIEQSAKFRPVEASKSGILLAGCAVAPTSVPEAMSLGRGAAARALALLSRRRTAVRPGAVAYRAKWCVSCGLCVQACGLGARWIDTEKGAVVDGALCRGCGACVAACPSGCSDQQSFDSRSVLNMIDAVWEVS